MCALLYFAIDEGSADTDIFFDIVGVVLRCNKFKHYTIFSSRSTKVFGATVVVCWTSNNETITTIYLIRAEVRT